MMRVQAWFCLPTLLASALASENAVAQCVPGWRAFDATTASVPGIDGRVFAATMWDPDGPGPIAPRLVIGGQFRLAVNTLANNIAVFDPATGQWSALGNGTNGTVNALTTLPDGTLIAGGGFTAAGGVTANRVAGWNGSAWFALGLGLGTSASDFVLALTALPNGDIVAGGIFAAAGGTAVNHIARWDGSAWRALGTGMSGTPGSTPSVHALTVDTGGTLVAGGKFTSSGGVLTNYIARWDGLGWSPIGNGMNSAVYALAALANAEVLAGGTFTSVSGLAANRIARWNGTSWSALGGGLVGGEVRCITTLPSGDIVAGGKSFIGFQNIARWNGTTWTAFGASLGPSSTNSVLALATLHGGDLIAGGDFTTAGNITALYIASWNGVEWSALGTGMDSTVYALAMRPNGVVAAGWFTSAGGATAKSVAGWDGAAWSGLGSGIGNGSVYAVEAFQSGDIVVGGTFTAPAYCIARWNGLTWSSIGPIDGSVVRALRVTSDGTLIAGGRFDYAGGVVANSIAMWNGSTWFPLNSGTAGTVYALSTVPDGRVFAGGKFVEVDGMPASRIAQWNGSDWSPLSAGIGSSPDDVVFALTSLPNGDLIAGGRFVTASGVAANNIARWDGTAWSAMGAGVNDVVYALATLRNGDVIAGGEFTSAGGVAVGKIARWDGTTWSAMGPGVAGPVPSVRALLALTNGDLIVGGTFLTAGGTIAPYIARWGCPPCPGDTDGDRDVDQDDIDTVLFNYGSTVPPGTRGDLDGDGDVDQDDVDLILYNYGTTC